MLKGTYSVKSDRGKLLEAAATTVLDLLRDVPFVTNVEAAQNEILPGGHHADLVVRASVAGEDQTLICEVKASAQPREVRLAILQLNSMSLAGACTEATSVLVAPYLSPKSALICQDAGVGFADFDGNCRIILGRAYIERRTERKRNSLPRGLKSLFAPKATRALRVMLVPPLVSWRIEDLAQEAGISVGHTSNVRRALIDMDWARADKGGLRITQPRELLETWGKSYKRRKPKRESYYTLLHGEALHHALHAAAEDLFRSAIPERCNWAYSDLILSSHSAAERLAPFASVQTLHAYVSALGAEALESHLDLSPAPRGANVLLEPISDVGVCYGASPPTGHGGVPCTSAIQTYLDLLREGERSEDAAAHLLARKIVPDWGQS